MGRKQFEPTTEERQKVYQLTAAGFTIDDIAKVIYRYGKPISVKTIRKYFAKELEVARIETVSSVAGRLFKKAMDGDTTAMIFYLKTRGGWKETQITQHSGEVITKKISINENEIKELTQELLSEY